MFDLLYCLFVVFCSLWYNQISCVGTHELAAALQVNENLQELK